MPIIRLGPFGGELPQLDELLLAPHQAAVARNVVLWSGTLRPMQGVFAVQEGALGTTPKTIFKYRASEWFEWDRDVDVVRSLAPNDIFGRVYFTGDGDGYPKVTDASRAVGSPPYPTSALRLGVPAPAAAPDVTVSGTGGGNPETRFYVYTYVNSYGEEGPPSPISIRVSVESGQTVDLTFTAPPGAPYDIKKIYIYRSNSADAATAVYQFVDEVELPTLTYADSVPTANLQEALVSATWDPPPDDTVGIINAGTFLVGFRQNELLISEQGLPHAFPVAYRRSVDYEIVGLCPIDGGFVVVTKGQPYVAIGAHPASLTVTPVRVPYGGVSKPSIVNVGGAVLYASARGLVRVSPGDAVMITEGVFDTEDWKRLGPSTIRAVPWRNLYLAFYQSPSGERGAFVIDPARPADGVVFFHGLEVGGVYADPETAQVFVAVNNQIAQWNAGAIWPFEWRSKPFELVRPATIGVIKVRAKGYPVAVTVYRDGQVQDRVQVGSPNPVRVKNAELGRTYAFEISASHEVQNVVAASTMEELKSAT